MVTPGSTRTPLRSYRELFAWQKSMDLVVACHEIARTLPATERFGLGAQLRRSAVSIPANMAEGYGRVHRAEYVHHVSIARGSLKETETHLIIAFRLGYISHEQLSRAESLADEVGRLTTRLLESLQKKGVGRRA